MNDVNNMNVKNILVVDDSNVIRTILKKLIGTGYNVIEASGGNDAINMVDTNSNIVGMFLDLNMPDVNGFDVLEHLKKINAFDRIPVAIITGDDSKETIYKAFDYKIVDVLNKPFNASDVNRIISSMEMMRKS